MTRRLAATHTPFIASLPSSLSTQGFSAETAFHYPASSLESSGAYCVPVDFVSMDTASISTIFDWYSIPVDFVLMDMASPQTDSITSLGAHAGSKDQLRRQRWDYI